MSARRLWQNCSDFWSAVNSNPIGSGAAGAPREVDPSIGAGSLPNDRSVFQATGRLGNEWASRKKLVPIDLPWRGFLSETSPDRDRAERGTVSSGPARRTPETSPGWHRCVAHALPGPRFSRFGCWGSSRPRHRGNTPQGLFLRHLCRRDGPTSADPRSVWPTSTDPSSVGHRPDGVKPTLGSPGLLSTSRRVRRMAPCLRRGSESLSVTRTHPPRTRPRQTRPRQNRRHRRTVPR